MILLFRNPGLLTLVQDMGRSGSQASGVSVGGAMDRESAHIANLLVGNATNSPLLEITLIGPEIQFRNDCQIAITGADLSAKLNGNAIPRYRTVNVPKASILSFDKPLKGCRAYLAVRGKWQINRWLDSASFASFGGETLTPQSKMQKNSLISVSSLPAILLKQYPIKKIPDFTQNKKIQVLPGPEFELFSRLEIAQFFSAQFTVTNDSNRMGYRLSGGNLFPNQQREIISSGIVPGTIQITRSGQPIVLMADAQTTGGYYRIANVVSADLNKLAQLRPGGVVSFVLDHRFEFESDLT